MKRLGNIVRWPLRRRIFFGMSVASATSISLILLVTAAIILSQCMSMQTEATSRQLGYISDQLDFFLKTVDNYSRTIAANPAVQELISRGGGNPLTGEDRLLLRGEVEKVIQSTEFIHSVSAYNADLEPVFSTEIYSSGTGLEGLSFDENLIWAPRLKISDIDPRQPLPVLSLIRRFYNYNSGALLGYLEISIPETAISNIYHQKSGGDTLFIADYRGTIESTDGQYEIYTQYRPFERITRGSAYGYRFHGNSIVFFRLFPKLSWYIISEVSLSAFFRPILTMIAGAIVIAAAGILLCTFLSHWISKTVSSPISRLIGHIQAVRDGSWTPMPPEAQDSEIGFLLENFNSMIAAQVKLKDDLIREQKLKRELSLNLLQQQINPHFLYNTLDNICSLAELGETDTLTHITMSLSRFYRKVLSGGSFFVTVGDELAITQSYLEIMRVRYFQKFDYEIRCPEAVRQCACLKLLLQPVVENSIYHGIKEITHRGFIRIEATADDACICFTVTDNGAGLPAAAVQRRGPAEAGFGLQNVEQRIRLYYGAEFGLTLENNEPEGCRAIIRIGRKMTGGATSSEEAEPCC